MVECRNARNMMNNNINTLNVRRKNSINNNASSSSSVNTLNVRRKNNINNNVSSSSSSSSKHKEEEEEEIQIKRSQVEQRERLELLLKDVDFKIGPTTDKIRRTLSQDALFVRNLEIQLEMVTLDEKYDEYEGRLDEWDDLKDMYLEESDEIEELLRTKFKSISGGRYLYDSYVLEARDIAGNNAYGPLPLPPPQQQQEPQTAENNNNEDEEDIDDIDMIDASDDVQRSLKHDLLNRMNRKHSLLSSEVEHVLSENKQRREERKNNFKDSILGAHFAFYDAEFGHDDKDDEQEVAKPKRRRIQQPNDPPEILCQLIYPLNISNDKEMHNALDGCNHVKAMIVVENNRSIVEIQLLHYSSTLFSFNVECSLCIIMPNICGGNELPKHLQDLLHIKSKQAIKLRTFLRFPCENATSWELIVQVDVAPLLRTRRSICRDSLAKFAIRDLLLLSSSSSNEYVSMNDCGIDISWIGGDNEPPAPPPPPTNTTTSLLDVRELYDMLKPSNDSPAIVYEQPNGLTCTLKRYQLRAMSWMYHRETRGSTEFINEPCEHKVYTSNGVRKQWTFSTNTAKLTMSAMNDDDNDDTKKKHNRYQIELNSGGILADEMGLGKSVEMIALILMNPSPPCPIDDQSYIYIRDKYVLPVKGTLIVSPQSILYQWKSEIERHSANLTVLHYEGVSRKAKKTSIHKDLEYTAKLLATYDVVITSYATLKNEVHFSREVETNLRFEKKHEIPETPLLNVKWWRVCVDEAQYIDSEVAKSAKMALRLFTSNRWCISGTPIGRHGLNDLYGLMLFLRASPFDIKPVWKVLCDEYLMHRSSSCELIQFLRKMCWRHSKLHVSDEIRLPSLTHEVVFTEFNNIEREFYSRSLDKARVKLLRGATDEDISTKKRIEELFCSRTLDELRSVCCHPQVHMTELLGQKMIPMKVIGTKLLEEAATNVREIERRLCRMYNRIGVQYYNYEQRYHDAERMFLEAWKISQNGFETRNELNENTLEESVATETKNEEFYQYKKIDLNCTYWLGKLKEIQLKELQPRIFDPNITHEQQREHIKKEHELKQQVHQMNFQFKKTLDDLLDAYTYRISPLKSQIVSFSQSLKRLMEASQQYTTDVTANMWKELWIVHHYWDGNPDHFYTNHRVFSLLNRFIKLCDTDEHSIHGAYCDTLVMSIREYMNLHNIRNDFMTKTHRAVLNNEFKIKWNYKHYSTTYIYVLTAKGRSTLKPIVSNEIRVVPSMIRDIHINHQSVLSETQQSTAKTVNRLTNILTSIQRNVKHVSDKLNTNNELVHKLRNDIRDVLADRPITKKCTQTCVNHEWMCPAEIQYRNQVDVLYQKNTRNWLAFSHIKSICGHYIELQVRVNEVKVEELKANNERGQLLNHVHEFERENIDELSQELNAIQREATKITGHYSYLKNSIGFDANGQRMECSLCRGHCCGFYSITPCGHKFGSECLSTWLQKRSTCPTCRMSINHDECKSIATRTTGDAVKSIEYTDGRANDEMVRVLNSNQLSEYCEFGTKAETIVKYIQYLRSKDKNVKALVYSQYTFMLKLVAECLKKNYNIPFVILEGSARESARKLALFQQQVASNDANVPCVLLLSMKSDNSGLTLTHASHVFLCEPSVSQAKEQQAINRIHRIGQTRDCFVHSLVVRNTVEHSIIKKRLVSSEEDALSHQQDKERLTIQDLCTYLNVYNGTANSS